MKKVALVTGAAAGIGRATSLRLARDGIAIGVLDLSAEGAATVAQEVVAAGGEALALTADVSDRQQVTADVERMREAYGPVNILINNAGMTDYCYFLELTDELWDQMLAVNLKSAIIVTQVVIPDMIAAG